MDYLLLSLLETVIVNIPDISKTTIKSGMLVYLTSNRIIIKTFEIL